MTPAKRYDVVTIDDALVDEFYRCTDEQLAHIPLPNAARATLMLQACCMALPTA